MVVGVVKEIKNHEYRVGLTPAGVQAFSKAGHTVLVENLAGEGAGFTNEEYEAAGAKTVGEAAAVWGGADMIIKVKEPVEKEYTFLRRGLILYTYLHLAADKALTDALLQSGTNAVAYETITDDTGALPCLMPMSAIAGRISVQEGAKYIEKPYGGRGVLLGGVPGVGKAEVVVIGGGVVGTNAAKMAYGLGATVTVLDTSIARLSYLDDIFGGGITTLYSSRGNLEDCLVRADVLIGAVLLPGYSAPKLVGKDDIKKMKQGAVIVDVAVDQGGCIQTTHPTTHQDPIFLVDGVVHYCVANMPGAVPRTATIALGNATLAYGLKIANMGLEKALAEDPGLEKGLNTRDGKLTCPGVAQAFGYEYTPAGKAV